MVKVADVAPFGTTTEAGTIALRELEVSETTNPPSPAFAPRVTVPVLVPPAITDAGLTESDPGRAGNKVS
jgi:hypothetical protein